MLNLCELQTESITQAIIKNVLEHECFHTLAA